MNPLLELKEISKNYDLPRSFGRNNAHLHEVLKKINLQMYLGDNIGLIGESGCGKTTLAKIAAGLEKPTHGQVLYNGKDIRQFNFTAMQKSRKDVQIVFQNSKSIFNPYHTIGKSLKHVLENFERLPKEEIKSRIGTMLEKVGLDESFADCYPEKLSGGQRQRANIARALIAEPKLIICDEPVASLDFSIRKKTLDMLNELINTMSLTSVFISHDISTVRYTCKKVAVMYRGSIVEIYPVEPGSTPQHPYSRMLMDSVPVSHPRQRIKQPHGKRSNIVNMNEDGNGCDFYNLCSCRNTDCLDARPDLKNMGGGHYLACYSCH